MNFIVMEAIAIKVGKEEQEAIEAAKREDWKRRAEELRDRVGT